MIMMKPFPGGGIDFKRQCKRCTYSVLSGRAAARGTRDKVILKRTGVSHMQRCRPRGEALLAFLDGIELGEEGLWGHPMLCSHPHPSCCCVLSEGSVIGGPLSSTREISYVHLLCMRHADCKSPRGTPGVSSTPENMGGHQLGAEE